MRKLLVASSVAALFALPSLASAHGSCDADPEHCVYWHDASGNYVKDSSGDCIRTSSWFAGTQIEGCDVIIPKDSDGDGVPDDMDRCPDTPMGAKVNSQGCELDSDNDGVVDRLDRCPNTPAGARVNSQGCELDSDSDGVVDRLDQCPNTPAGARVDNRGCELDSDNDGVVDSRDQCPGTVAGARVDDKGCAIAQFETVSVDLQVNFESNSANVKSAYAAQMGALAHVLKSNPDARIQIAGHTDSVGNAQYNMDLSKQRADAVAEHLMEEYGVGRDQLSTVGYGESRPIADNSTAEGRRLNRRVEAEISAQIRQ